MAVDREAGRFLAGFHSGGLKKSEKNKNDGGYQEHSYLWFLISEMF